MRFETIIEKDKIILGDTDSGTKAAIFLYGALLKEFSILKNGEETNVINGFKDHEDAVKNMTGSFKSAKLFPFVCRVRDGEYSFEGVNYKINKFYLNKEALHGLMFDAVFEIKETQSNDKGVFATLVYHYTKKDEGFPFAFDMEVTYLLQKDNLLSIATVITNTGNTDMPLSDGWHPYFKLGKKVDDLKVQLNTNKILEFDERLLPTGKLLPFDKFKLPETFGETSFDHCFLLNEGTDTACILRDECEGLELKVLAGRTYPYLQIFTPSDRESIALENLSSAPDAFNNGMGLIVAKPGQTCQFKTAYQLTLL